MRRVGLSTASASVIYNSNDGTASQKGDYIYATGRLDFAPDETEKSFAVLINEDSYAEGLERFTLVLSNPTGATLGAPIAAEVQIIDDEPEISGNPIDEARNFVCQNYHDFLNRQPDEAGLQFWTEQITSCGDNQACVEDQRQRVSTAFFLSIEFQNTGYLVFRFHRASYGSLPTYTQFLRDTQRISKDVVVGQPGWEQQLAANQEEFAREWVSRPEFTSRYPDSMSREGFVNALFANSEVTPTQAERDAAQAAYGDGGVSGRARALRRVAESGSVYNRQYNAGFVLMQYIGYLRRHPSDPPDNNLDGFNFWLQKLNGNSTPGEDVRNEAVALRRVSRAQMVLAFISSAEYRQRFGP